MVVWGWELWSWRSALYGAGGPESVVEQGWRSALYGAGDLESMVEQSWRSGLYGSVGLGAGGLHSMVLEDRHLW